MGKFTYGSLPRTIKEKGHLQEYILMGLVLNMLM